MNINRNMTQIQKCISAKHQLTKYIFSVFGLCLIKCVDHLPVMPVLPVIPGRPSRPSGPKGPGIPRGPAGPGRPLDPGSKVQ